MAEHCWAPWSEDQVASLNAYQESGHFHPFTCGQRDDDGEAHLLRATREGWYCPKCAAQGKDYSQAWCHGWMADWSWQ
jgi:hypothetical protein